MLMFQLQVCTYMCVCTNMSGTAFNVIVNVHPDKET